MQIASTKMQITANISIIVCNIIIRGAMCNLLLGCIIYSLDVVDVKPMAAVY